MVHQVLTMSFATIPFVVLRRVGVAVGILGVVKGASRNSVNVSLQNLFPWMVPAEI